MLAKKKRKQTRLFEQADPGQSFLALIQVEHAGVFYNALRESDERQTRRRLLRVHTRGADISCSKLNRCGTAQLNSHDIHRGSSATFSPCHGARDERTKRRLGGRIAAAACGTTSGLGAAATSAEVDKKGRSRKEQSRHQTVAAGRQSQQEGRVCGSKTYSRLCSTHASLVSVHRCK